MTMEHKDDNEIGRSEDHSSLHPCSGHPEELPYNGTLLTEDVGDTNELVDESAQVTSKQRSTVARAMFSSYIHGL